MRRIRAGFPRELRGEGEEEGAGRKEPLQRHFPGARGGSTHPLSRCVRGRRREKKGGKTGEGERKEERSAEAGGTLGVGAAGRAEQAAAKSAGSRAPAVCLEI